MTVTDTQRYMVSIAVLIFFGATVYIFPLHQVQTIQTAIFAVVFIIGYSCMIKEWNSPISTLTWAGLFPYGLLFFTKDDISPYLIAGWQYYIGALILLETILFLWKMRKPRST